MLLLCASRTAICQLCWWTGAGVLLTKCTVSDTSFATSAACGDAGACGRDRCSAVPRDLF